MLVDEITEQPDQFSSERKNLDYFIQSIDKKNKIEASDRTKTFFAELIQSNLQNYSHEHLMKMPVVINKLELDDVKIKGDGNLTEKLVEAIQSRSGQEKQVDGNIEASARSVRMLLKNLVQHIVQEDGSVILNDENKKLILDQLDLVEVHVYKEFITLLNTH